MMGFDAAAKKQTAPPVTRPGQEWGRHSRTQKLAKMSHHCTFTTLSSTSPGATGKRTIAATSRPLMNRLCTKPAEERKTTSARAATNAAPVTEMTNAASATGTCRMPSNRSRGSSWT